jgi:hypothetical protein
MTSKPVAFLLADLGITQSHSRPHLLTELRHALSLVEAEKQILALPSAV